MNPKLLATILLEQGFRFYHYLSLGLVPPSLKLILIGAECLVDLDEQNTEIYFGNQALVVVFGKGTIAVMFDHLNETCNVYQIDSLQFYPDEVTMAATMNVAMSNFLRVYSHYFMYQGRKIQLWSWSSFAEDADNDAWVDQVPEC